MRIGIIGAGAMGELLAQRLAGRGHEITIANARGPESLIALASGIGVIAASPVDAARGAEIVILAIPTKAVPELPSDLFAGVAQEAIVVDVTNYHPALRDGPIGAIDEGMPDSQWVAREIGRPVVKAFNSILAQSLRDKSAPKGAPGRIALPVAGDSAAAKAIVFGLIDEMGFEPIDAGNLTESWRQQPGAPAYCKDLGAEALARALANADPRRIGAYRAEREAEILEAAVGR
jgi:8-hydroxy-5-deazaflavin:NADPH oxidoreductase